MKSALTRKADSLKRCLFCLIMILYAATSNASHIMGGEISYQWQSGTTYTVRLNLYRDCMGILFDPVQTIEYRSATCGLNNIFTVYQVGTTTPVSPICNASVSNSSCNGGPLFGVEQWIYEGVVTLPGNCSDWVLSYIMCCRNGMITNLSNAASSGSYFSATLNNLNVPFNNSVTFGNIPYNIINSNITTQLSWNAFDVDGDVLTYELVPARDLNGFIPVNLVYEPGYTFSEPFLASQPTILNTTNGMLEVTPSAQQVSVVCVKISEFRNGILVGEVYRDYQIAVLNTSNNLPVLTGMNGSSNYNISGCPGDSIYFTVTGTDPDIPQVVTLSMSNPGTTATFLSTPGIVSQGIFSWVPVISDISADPYIFIITANDDNCDYYGTNSQAYYVYVNGCNTNDVWPGDANSDGDANLYDLLAVGLAYGETGPVRPAASLTWVAQPCPDWSNYFISGINHKHADTDGDGAVTWSDTAAIYLNYGLNHPLRNSNPNTTSIADLLVTSSSDSIGLSSVVNFDIALATPVDSIYGLAFRMYFDPALIQPDSIHVTYAGSIFGTDGIDMVRLDRSQGLNGFVDIALSRVNQSNVTGSGPVVRVTIVTTDNVSGKVTLTAVPSSVIAVTSHEYPVQLNGIGDAVVIDPNYVGINEINDALPVSVYPNPANELLHFRYDGSGTLDYLKLLDASGREILHVATPRYDATIDIRELSAGTYLLKVSAGGKITHKKIMIF